MNNKQAIDQLIGNADDLLVKLRDDSNPEVKRLSAKLEAGIAEAKKAATQHLEAGAQKIREATDSVVGYVRANPWVAVAAGTAIAAALVYIAFSSRGADED
jgi:ElaB/YqjD/DUF883 family membrane-anchored ribosome-binding protein